MSKYSYNGHRYDRIETESFWSRLKSHVIKRWRIIINPFVRFFVPGGVQNDEPVAEPEPAPAAQPAVAETEPVSAEAAPAEASEPEFDTSNVSQEDLDLANEILARLEAEAAADAAAKAAEIEAAKAQAAAAENINHDKSAYNAATHSYSGEYGKEPIDGETADIVAELLKQNNRSSIDF